MEKIEEILLKDITFKGLDIFTKSELLSISSLDFQFRLKMAPLTGLK
jgi:hypothetical protein